MDKRTKDLLNDLAAVLEKHNAAIGAGSDKDPLGAHLFVHHQGDDFKSVHLPRNHASAYELRPLSH